MKKNLFIGYNNKHLINDDDLVLLLKNDNNDCKNIKKLNIQLNELPKFIDNSTNDYHLIAENCDSELYDFLSELASIYATSSYLSKKVEKLKI